MELTNRKDAAKRVSGGKSGGSVLLRRFGALVLAVCLLAAIPMDAAAAGEGTPAPTEATSAPEPDGASAPEGETAPAETASDSTNAPEGETVPAETASDSTNAPEGETAPAEAASDPDITGEDLGEYVFINSYSLIAGGQGDMKGLLGEVTIEDHNGETVKDGKLYVGEKYTIHLKFQEKGAQSGDAGQFSWTVDGKMRYQIPSNFKVTPQKDVTLRAIIDGETVEIGTFSIDESGLLTIQLNDEGKKRLADSNNIALSFDMDATAQKTEGGSDVDVNFGDTGEDFKFKVTDQPQITVDKKSKYHDSDHTLEYTVSTKVDHGPVHDLVVSDTLTPPNSKGITLKMVNDADGKPDVTVTVIRDGKTVELTEDDYELVPVTTNPANPYAPQTFQVKLKTGGKYDPLGTDDELQVTYKYQAEFDKNAADIYWGQVVNEATVTGSMPIEDPQPGGEKEIPVKEERVSYAEVYWDTDGKGVVSKDEAYSEATGKLHYTLYAAVKAGDYTPFYIQDEATVEYNGHTWTVQGFDASHFKDLQVYAQDVAEWKDGALPEPAGEKKRLTGSAFGMYPEGYYAGNMDYYFYSTNEQNTDLFIFFGMDQTHPQGRWQYETERLITVEYDLDVSEGLTLYRDKDGVKETVTLSKEEVLLTGITNTVHLRYGPFYPGFSVFFSNGEKLNKTGRLDKVHNTIDYTVSLDLKDTTVWDYLKDVNSKPILSAIFYDDYDNGWTYVDGSLGATVYDRNGGAVEYNYYPDGGAEWQGKDDFTDGDIKAYLWNFKESHDWTITNYFVSDYDGDLDRIEFTYTLKASDQWLKEHAYVTDAANVHNEAAIRDDTTTHWSAKADVPYFPNRLTKTAVQDGTSNLLTFTLEINSVGADLDPEKDYLIVTDESSGIQIRPSSIKVTDGNGNELQGIGNTTVDADMMSDQWGLLPTGNEHQYQLKVPDGKVLRITYEAMITEMGDSVPVSNKASIKGVARTDSSYEGALHVDHVSAGGEGSTYELTIEKIDSEQRSKMLAGATFKFYIVRDGEGLRETAKIPVDGKEYSCYSEETWQFTTDAYGQYTIRGWNLEPGNYYILEETEAPAGYQKLEPFLFYYNIKSSTADVDPNAKETVTPNGMLTVADPPENNLRVVKTDALSAPEMDDYFLDGAVFELRKDDGTVLYTGTSGTGGVVQWTDAADASVGADLKLGKGTYFLEETDAPDGYNKLEDMIQIDVAADGSITLADPPEGVVLTDGTPTVTITVPNSSSYELPESGGAGTAWLYTLGAALLFTAAALLVCDARRRRTRG